MNNNLFICSATKGKREDTLLHQTKGEDVEVFFKEFNKKPLQQVYNKAIDFAIKENMDHIVLCHDDIILENFDYEKLKKHFEKYDVLGVAGASQIKVQEPALWHLMGGGFGSSHLHGAVAHLHGNSKKSMTAFGPYPHQALIMDGVFLAISRKAFKKAFRTRELQFGATIRQRCRASLVCLGTHGVLALLTREQRDNTAQTRQSQRD